MGEDTFSRDDLLGSWEIKFGTLEEYAVVGDMDMHNAEGKKIGTIDVSVEYEAGDGTVFRLIKCIFCIFRSAFASNVDRFVLLWYS